MASWIKNMKDGSKRIKDEIVRTIGAGEEDGFLDPALEHRYQRFKKYNDNLDKLSRAMAHYLETSQAHTQATVQLMHSFSAFFEAQMQDASPEDEDYTHTKSLAQGALRLEEIHQSLRANVFDTAHYMQVNDVVRSIQHVRKSNTSIQKQLAGLKQRLMDYDSIRRSAEGQRRNTPEYERAAQREAAAKASLITLTNELNTELSAFEARRSIDMKNELLTVVACQFFVHARAHQHYEQLVPLLPGMAKPLLQIVEYARGRPHTNPAERDTMGVVNYTGDGSRGVMEKPLQYHHKLAPIDASSVHPLPSTKFAEIHAAEKLAISAYSRHQ